jgi:hypothetical protein
MSELTTHREHRDLDPITAHEQERFWRMVSAQAPDECWEWTGNLSAGYGTLGLKRDGRWVTTRAHRVSWTIHRGPIPTGLQLDHLCRNRACVNPAHLEPVTNRVNGLRGVSACAQNARKSHCLRGHEYTPENTRVRSTRYGTDGRECRICSFTVRRQGYEASLRSAPYECDLCKSSFHSEQYLLAHRTRLHRLPGARELILQALVVASDGRIGGDLADELGRNPRSLGATIGELAALGLVADSGRRDRTPRGKQAIVWQITAAGRIIHEQTKGT